jgi:hypothetical protein
VVVHLVYININLFPMFRYIVLNIICIFVCAIFADIIDLCAITKLKQTKKVSEPTFLHRIKRCCGILFGLSAQVSMVFIFDINTNLNENNKEMSKLTKMSMWYSFRRLNSLSNGMFIIPKRKRLSF